MAHVIRWLLGLAVIAKGIETLSGAAGAGSQGGAIGSALFGFAFIIIGAVVISPELAAWAATPFNRFIDSVYLPGGTFAEKPEPNYRLAEYYYRSLQHDLAIAEYEKIIRHHPRETRAYIALVDLWANRKSQPGRAAKLYRRGLRKVRKRASRKELREAYRSDDATELVLGDTSPAGDPLGGRVKFPELR